MMQPAIELQASGDAVYFIADYHALTTVESADKLRGYVHEVALAFLACGLDTNKAILFRQSEVPEVNELAWLLSVVTPMGLLERCHSYKDKTARGLAANVGLFTYPVLMAADILLYQSDRVPVGKDQKQHLEVARDIAHKFNERFGPVFKIPEPEIREAVQTIPGTDGQKMSKSYKNTLDLFGDSKAFGKAIMGIKTDSTPVDQPKPVDGATLPLLYRLVSTDAEYAAYVGDMQKGGKGYGDFKKELLAKLDSFLAPFRARHDELKGKPELVEQVLADGARKARALAAPTLAAVRKATGLT